MASLPHSPAALTGPKASDLLRSSSGGFPFVPLRILGRSSIVGSSSRVRRLSIVARVRKVKKHEYPWPSDPDPNVKGGVLFHLSHFKPSKIKPKPVPLEFEKPLLDLERKINDVRKMANETGLDFTDQIQLLENKYQQALKDLYTHLTPIQRVNIARHPNRPTFLDHVFSITEKFVELHGDRAGYDDPAIVTGIGTMDGRRYMFMGHQKGRNTKENIKRNFGMPTPHGYRKALRMMYYADHHGFPIITFIDTPGAFADLRSEELGQGEAIAQNLRTMFGLKVPIISIVIGEGGSGGALAIGCANKLLMLENAVFYVASPEACAAILWKTAKASPKAAEKLKITAKELCKLQIADGIIPEPLGGAHADPEWTSQQLKKAINETMDELTKMNTEELLKHRSYKFRKLGGFQEGITPEPAKRVNTTRIPVAELGVEVKKVMQKISEAGVETEKQKISKAGVSIENQKISKVEAMINRTKREVEHELSEVVKAIGLEERFKVLKEKIKKAKQQPTDLTLVQETEKLRKDLGQRLAAAPNIGNFKSKLKKWNELLKFKKISEQKRRKAKMLKQQRDKKLREITCRPEIKEKMDELKAEIQKLRTSGIENSDREKEDRIAKMKMELNFELAIELKKLGFNVDGARKWMKREVEHEFFEAVKAIGLEERVKILKEEIEEAEEPTDPTLVREIEKLRDDLGQRLSAAPNYGNLKSKLEKLNQLSEVDKIKEQKRTVEMLDFIVDGVQLIANQIGEKVSVEELNAKAKALEQETTKKMEDAMQSPEVKSLVQMLKGEVAKAGTAPDPDTKSKIEALENQIEEKMAAAMDSPDLKEKHAQLSEEVFKSIELVGGSNGNVETGDQSKESPSYDETSVEINASAS